MDNRANVDQAVFEFLRPELKRYREDVAELSSSAARAIAQARSNADSVVSNRRMQLDAAQHALGACLRQEDADCSGYRHRVEDCNRALENAIRGRDLIQSASSAFLHAQSTYRNTVDQLVLRAEKVVRVADERTADYQHVEPHGSATTAGTGAHWIAPEDSPSWRDLPGVLVPECFPDGFAAIPVDLIDSDERTADANEDIATARWSAEALLDVVLPAMSSMTDVDQYLSDRDARDAPVGTRSYVATYSTYFSPDSAIRLTPMPHGFSLVSGAHRLRALRRAGARTVPALIGGT